MKVRGNIKAKYKTTRNSSETEKPPNKRCTTITDCLSSLWFCPADLTTLLKPSKVRFKHPNYRHNFANFKKIRRLRAKSFLRLNDDRR